MKNITKTIATSSAIVAGVMMASSAEVYAGTTMEKCYGIAKAASLILSPARIIDREKPNFQEL